MDFIYQDPYPILKDDTQYRKITSDFVKTEKLGDREILTVDPKGLELLAQEALKDVSFMLRTAHLEKLKEIYSEKELGKFKTALLLGIAYASSIGGMATLIGTPTNLVFVKIYESAFKSGVKINFANWLIFAFPIYFILIVAAIIVLYLFFKPRNFHFAPLF